MQKSLILGKLTDIELDFSHNRIENINLLNNLFINSTKITIITYNFKDNNIKSIDKI